MLLVLLACATPPAAPPAPPLPPTPVPTEIAPPKPEIAEVGPLVIASTEVKDGAVLASGSAIAWEGALTLELRVNGAVVASQPVRASAAAPARGEWTTTLQIPAEAHGPAELRAWIASPKDGSAMHEATAALTLP